MKKKTSQKKRLNVGINCITLHYIRLYVLVDAKRALKITKNMHNFNVK